MSERDVASKGRVPGVIDEGAVGSNLTIICGRLNALGQSNEVFVSILDASVHSHVSPYGKFRTSMTSSIRQSTQVSLCSSSQYF